MEKIGIGIITYKRNQYFKKLIATIPFDKVDEVVVVNDDPEAEPCDCPDKQYEEIINDKNYGVGISKNKALEYLIEKGCTHLFIIEDDIEIIDETVFDVYIRTAKRSGLYHLAFGHVGGPLKKQIKGTRDYTEEIGIQMYHNPQGSFCYYLANVIKKIGYLDPNYKNAFEHVDHEYQLIKAGLLPAFWWFPDVKDSHKYLMITPGGVINSSITDKPEYTDNYKMSAKYFTEKWGHFTNQIADVNLEYINNRLDFIETNYCKQIIVNMIKVYPNENIYGNKHLYPFVPFWGNNGNPNHPSFNMLDKYIEDVTNNIILSNIDDCDFIIYPLKYTHPTEPHLLNLLKLSKQHNKKLILLFEDDFDGNLPIVDDNILIFKTSILKTNQNINEFSYPAIVPDYCLKNDFTQRKKQEQLTIGFCGWPIGIRLKILENINENKTNKIVTNIISRTEFWGTSSQITQLKQRNEFIENIVNNDYTLCVRGNGNFSYRFFETLCLGRIPIFINTNCVLPFEKEINYKNHVVWVEYDEIDNITEILLNFHDNLTDEQFINMQINNRKLWEEYFSPLGFIKKIKQFI